MLPNINLDDEMFSDITEDAKKLITKYSSEWTDFNAHDPGMTFLELFAWTKEIQQYRMNRIGRASRRRFLKLLGISPSNRIPASTYVQVRSNEGEVKLAKGTPFYAGSIRFEIEDEVMVYDTSIVSGYSKAGGRQISIASNSLTERNSMHMYPFGRKPEKGDLFQLFLDRSVPAGRSFTLYMNIFDDYEIKRNRPEAGFLPLADISWKYFSAEGWRNLTVVEDETSGFLCSGCITFQLDGDMASCTEAGFEGSYAIRAELEGGEFDLAPILTGLCIGSVHMVQKDTRASFRDVSCASEQELEADATYLELTQKKRYFVRKGDSWKEIDKENISYPAEVRILSFYEEFAFYMEPGQGDGFPYQRFILEQDNLMWDELELMAETSPGVYEEWERVTDLELSGPEDRHYCFSESTGEIIFGDCEKGMAPEGKILIIHCAQTLDVGGNVKAGSISSTDPQMYDLEVTSFMNASGGRVAESIDDGFDRYLRTVRETDRAVTFNDYEELVMKTPGLMLRNCKAISAARMPRPDGSIDENCVNIMVQPFSTDGVSALSKRYIENIHRQLDDRQMICTKVNIIPPEYIGIIIFAEIAVKPYYRNAEVEIKACLDSYFEEISGDFGKPVLYSTIYGILDTMDCVAGINSLVVDAQGRGIKRSVTGDVILPQNGMAFLKESDFVLTVSG